MMLGWVRLQKLWVGLSWVMKNGPMSMSEFETAAVKTP